MSVREIPIDQWSEFLDQFSRAHRAWLATVDRVQPDSISHTEAIERPLGAVVPQSVPGASPASRFGFSAIRARTSPFGSKGRRAFASTRQQTALRGVSKSPTKRVNAHASGSVPRPCLRCWTASRQASCRHDEYRETTPPHKTGHRRNHGCIGRRRPSDGPRVMVRAGPAPA